LHSAGPGADIHSTAISGDPQVYFTAAPSVTVKVTLERTKAPGSK
jgi:hypothetical protein